MADELVTGLLKGSELRVVAARVTAAAKQAKQLHELRPASAALLAEGLCAGALLAALQKERTRINLQLSCDGALGGMFVDADSGGALRGYVKNPLVEFLGAEGQFHYRPALGNSGYLSVLRERKDGEYYRSSIELKHFELAKDLQEFFSISEQLPAAIALASDPQEEIVGLLVQPLPKGDREELWALQQRIQGPEGLGTALHASSLASIAQLAETALGRELDVLSRTELSYQCTCTKARMLVALAALGAQDLQELIATQGQAEVTCQFCGRRHVATKEDLQKLLA